MDEVNSRGPIAARLKDISDSKAFNAIVIFVILFGALLVGLGTDPGIKAAWLQWIDFLEWLVLAFFCLELLVRIGAEGRHPLNFFRDPWNVFDFIIIAACFLPIKSKALFVLRLVRILRTLRLFRAFPKLRIILTGMTNSFSSVLYVVLLLCLLIYIFAVLGVSAFSEIDPANFGGLLPAFFTLFQVLTLESWNVIMLPVTIASPVWGPIYFVSFIILGTMIIMNLILGVIVSNMSKAVEDIEKTADLENYLDEDAAREELLAKKLTAIEAQLAALNKKLSEKQSREKK
ncbi:MAG: ion transporter [Candidatus Diapherotrites archaeon]